MGRSTSVAQLNAKFGKLSKALADTSGPLNITGMAGKRIFEAHASRAGVLGSTIAGKRKAIGVRYDFNNRRSKTVGQGTLVVTFTGPAHLVANPTAPHFIGARRLGSRRRLAGLASGVGAVSAFGGSARGMFGSLGPATRTSRSGVTRRTGAAALTINSDLRAYAFHPGTRGKQFARLAIAQGAAELPGVYARAQITAPLRQIFG